MAIKIRIVSDFDAKGITKANQALDDMGKAAGVALAAVGVAMVGIGVKSVQEFAKFDAALVKSKAIMGDLTQAMEKDMSDAAREVAKVTTFSAEQAAESYFFLASAGLDAESSIAALPQVAQFAQAGMFDMARATDLLTDAQSALGLTIRDDAVANMNNMIKVSDVLVRANTLANASVEQFSEALTTKAGASLRDLGKDVEEGVAVLAAFADQGIKGSEAGTQLGIVLRDLTTKALKNKEGFKEFGIAVFDSNGEMNNLGDIVADLEVALAGMSDETRKATLLQLGFSDKSLASLQALLGTSEAIKTYEKELRSASGFTENVASKQLDTFESQMKLLESAFIDVAIQIGEELTPYLKDLIPVIQRLLPEIGDKLTAAVKQVDWEKLATDVANLFTGFVDNIDTIVEVGRVLGLLAIAFATYTAATTIATTATALFNSTLKLNPIGLALSALVLLIPALKGVADAVGESNKKHAEANTVEAKRTTKIKDLLREQERLERLVAKGAATNDQTYVPALERVTAELEATGYSAQGAGAHISHLNDLKLTGLQTEMVNTANAARQLFAGTTFTGSGGTAEWLNQMFGTGPNSVLPTIVTAVNTTFSDAKNKVRDLIDSSQKQLDDATKSFQNSQKSAREAYASGVLKVEKEFGNRLLAIVQQSQNRLRDAYRQATAVSLESLFEFEDTKSVQNLVQGLSNKLAASKALLSNSAQLAAEGFSQTFIEQIVSAGTETGNELASAILSSEPDTKAELKKLFLSLEATASSGMDSLAKEIYDKQGFATQELKNLYEQTGIELEQALFDQQATLANALEDAAMTLYESVKSIREDFESEIASMGKALGGMEGKITEFKKTLGATEEKAIEEAVNAATMPGGSLTTASSVVVAASQIGNAAGILIDSISDIGAVYGYLGDRIAGAEAYLRSGSITSAERMSASATLEALRSAQTGIYNTARTDQSALVGTTININVKADTSQSLAMVGKSLGNTVAKYVTGGGQVIVSPV